LIWRGKNKKIVNDYRVANLKGLGMLINIDQAVLKIKLNNWYILITHNGITANIL
jgi:hypothetical protein